MFEVQLLDLILTRWRTRPDLAKRGYEFYAAWTSPSEANARPPADEEIVRMKARLREYSPATYFRIFPEEE